MPFKKPNNNNKNKTKKNQKKAPSDGVSSVEEIVISDVTTYPVPDASLEEVQVEKILTEEELAEIAKREAEIAAHEMYMWETYYRPQQEENIKRWQDYQIASLNDPEYWEERRSRLLASRQQYHKKAAWSAEIIREIRSIDNDIEYCEQMMDTLDGVEREIPVGNPILGGMDWWKDGLHETDGWISSK